jgi:4-aminobutyrate aminotransferase-like enzyme
MQNPLGITWKKAKNEFVWDSNGKKYIDFTSTIFVANVGHSNKRVKKYVKRQINKNLIHSYTFNTDIREKFVNKLIEITPSFCEKAFLLSSGTEATEASVKLMRAYTKRNIIVSFKGAMHGRTMAAELMKASGVYQHKDFVALDFPSNNSNFIKEINKLKINTKDIAGFMIETYQGWSARYPDKNYIQQLCSFAKKNKSLICFDEIQSGLGRTGRLFGYEYFNVDPDLICIGKAIGNGIPLSGVLGRADILDTPNAGDMSSTHSANPISCAAGLAVLDEIEKRNVISKTHFKGAILISYLIKIQRRNNGVVERNGRGLVGALIFKDKKIAMDICKECLRRGLILVCTGGKSIKIGPPLIISKKNLIKGFKILEEVINEY